MHFDATQVNIAAVKRLILILFVIMLPLQNTWAAVSAYCLHEQQSLPSSHHMGHHDHEHHDASSEQGTSNSGGFQDDDCHHCHVTSAAIISEGLSPPALDMNRHSFPAATSALPLLVPDKPERPKWHPVA